MSDQAIFQNGKQSWDKNLGLTLKIDLKNDGNIEEEFSPKNLEINFRNNGECDLLQPIGGAHPCQDDDDKSTVSKTTDENLYPSSFITLKDEKDNVEEAGTMLNAKTSVNSSQFSGVEVKATHPSQEEGKQSTPVETERLCTQQEGQPTTASQSVGKAKVPNLQALLEDEVPETKDKVEQGKLGFKKIMSSGKKKKDTTCHQQNVAKMMSVTIPNIGFGMKLNVTAVCLFFLFGGVHAFKGPTNQVVKRGDQAVMTCFTDFRNPIKWFKNHKLLYSGYDFVTDFNGSYAIANGSEGHYDLIVNNANEMMAGFYTCQQSRDVKNVTARLIVLEVNCCMVETNVTAAMCTAVITGNNMTRLLWEIIHGDSVTNATGTVILINSDTVDGIQRQNITSSLILSGNDLHTNGVCRLSLVFNERSAINLRPAEQMADNIPTYTVGVPFNASTDENRNSTPPASANSTVLFAIVSVLVTAVAITVVGILIYRRLKERAGPGNRNGLL